MTIQLGYCTNVHAGVDLEQTQANLEQFALVVKRRFSPDAPMGVGLWLSASAARSLLDGERLPAFAAWLAEVGLVPFTLNGFPYGDFHRRVVKHDVYKPTWLEPARAEYTSNLITILHRLLAPGLDGSISTLPLAWGEPAASAVELDAAAAALRRLAGQLATLEKETGRRICLCLEPEPGCLLQRSTDIVRFFQDHLLRGPDEVVVRRHVAVCHDICHAAVMFEEQAEVLQRYRAAGIGVGKVQVSSAVALDLTRLPPSDRAAALRQLESFAEDRYLHQTMVRSRAGAAPVFYEDLPLALSATPPGGGVGEWRVHFHVPIYLQRFGYLDALQQHILDCLRFVAAHGTTDHFEVETYAWGVLPVELQQPDLAAGIADEMAWFRGAWLRQVDGE
jgi:sugar phosphate isomerase/epimerase